LEVIRATQTIDNVKSREADETTNVQEVGGANEGQIQFDLI
jgi:hypothetical protein